MIGDARRVAGAIRRRSRRRYLMRKWADHADPRTLDWDWTGINFNRIAVVNRLLAKYSDPAYLEIGCGTNALFDSVPVRNKVGVDPVSGGTTRTTSDAFFSGNTATFDVVFIDGLHTYEQVRRDVINSIGCLSEGGWIALHDMLPRNWLEHHVPCIDMSAWTGDVWKVAFELSQTPGIDFKILRMDCGIGVFKVNNSFAQLNDLRGELLEKEFSYYYDNLAKLPLIEWDEAVEWLRS